jgi:phosphatidylglycerol:prolipoprotein diacylglycerol transferase
VYPTLIRIGTFEITTFGVMVALGALAGLWLFARELRLRRLPEAATNAAALGVVAGLIGAKLLFVVEHSAEEPLLSLLTSRGGLSWFGGLFGGVGAALAYIRSKRWPLLPIVAAATPALAVGHLLGRIGCFLVGDDYGFPSTLPWAVAFPQGLPPTIVPVHPTQLYEAALLAVLAFFLIRWRRAGVSDRAVLGRYLIFTGAIRFAIEFLRINPRVVLGLTVAQCGALIVLASGIALLGRTAGRAAGSRR